MLSAEQERIKQQKILLVSKIFLESNKTIEEIAKETGISSSSVQRYLNNYKEITNILGQDAYYVIQAKLKNNKENGLSKGGKVTQSRYYQTKDSEGKYTGNIKR